MNSNSDGRWQFWIDVGGTFTDCIARRPDGAMATHKLLSSGVYKSEIAAGSSETTLLLTNRTSDPKHFFAGWRLTVLQPGPQESEVRILESDLLINAFDASRGAVELNRPLKAVPQAGMLVELASPEEAPVTGIRWLMGRRLGEEIGPVDVRLGTTRGTNALLER
ncbi:MAG: hydantoinase, partial [Thermoleophilia bacterium]|nr:hydantoinase [Thermoleophilia bacterium]